MSNTEQSFVCLKKNKKKQGKKKASRLHFIDPWGEI